MKTAIIKSAVLSVILTLVFISCRREPINSSNLIRNEITQYMTSGTWRVSYFNDSGDDETHHFSGYSFRFDGNGTVRASGLLATYNGFWSITDCNGSNDHNSIDDLHFNIHFNLDNDFDDLNDDWEVLSYSPYQLALFDISNGGSGTDYLTFSRE